nr:L-asparaginase-like [Danio rerio]|eukprot:XP_021332649.1 L-asparaginase-like [Danio rerio]
MRRSLINRIIPSFACLAVKNNDFIALSGLLEKTEVSHRTYDDSTALHTACELGNIDMIKFLLSKGASHHLDHRGNCPLYMAVKNRHHHAVSLLHFNGATVTKPPVTIAMEMIQVIQIKDHRLLLAWAIAGVDMDAQDYNGRTAMHEAVYLGDVFMIRKLLEYGATPLMKDVWGQTAVDDAQNKAAIMALFEPIFTVHCPTKEAYLLCEPKLSVRY